MGKIWKKFFLGFSLFRLFFNFENDIIISIKLAKLHKTNTVIMSKRVDNCMIRSMYILFAVIYTSVIVH
jgi:hypothetical protein